jgi:hypothetical protein
MNNPLDVKANDGHSLDFPLHLFVYCSCFHPRTLVYCLIIGRVSDVLFPKFAQNLMLFFYRIHREIAQARYTTQNRRM